MNKFQDCETSDERALRSQEEGGNSKSSQGEYEMFPHLDEKHTEIVKNLTSFHWNGMDIAPLKMHPRADEASVKVETQLREIFGSESLLNRDLAGFTYYSYPMVRFEFLCYLVLLSDFFFLMDDFLDEQPGESSKWVMNFRNQSCSGTSRLDRMFKLVISKGMELIGTNKLAMLLAPSESWIKLSSERQRITQDGKISDSEHLEMRLVDLNAYTFFEFLKIETGCDCQLEACTTENWINFERNIAFHLVIINDLYSIRKELREGAAKYNYVYLKMSNNNLSAEEAFAVVMAEAKEFESKAIRFGNHLKELNSECINHYVDQMLASIYGNHYWSNITKRYHF